MGLLQAQLGSILDRDDTLGLWDKRRDDVQRRRFTRTRTTGYEDVHAGLDAGAQELSHLAVDRAKGYEVLHGERLLREFTDGEARPFEGQRRDDDIDTGAILETGIDERRCLIDTAAERCEDTVHDMHEMVVIVELHLREFQLAHALDEDLIRPIDHDLADGLILMQGLDRSQAQHIVDDIIDHLPAVIMRDGKRILLGKALDIPVDDLLNLGTILMAGQEDGLLARSHLIDNALMDSLLRQKIRFHSIIFCRFRSKDTHLMVRAIRPPQACQKGHRCQLLYVYHNLLAQEFST